MRTAPVAVALLVIDACQSGSVTRLKGLKPVTCELKAGSCTVHNGMTFHYAGPNRSDGMREAIAIIYMPDGTTYHKVPHPVTDPLKLSEGAKLNTEMFPLVSN